MKLQFKCPNCGGNRLQEKMVDVVLISEITEINIDDTIPFEETVANLEYGYKTTDEGEVEHYICIGCDYIPVDSEGNAINDCMDLPWWIKENCSG